MRTAGTRGRARLLLALLLVLSGLTAGPIVDGSPGPTATTSGEARSAPALNDGSRDPLRLTPTTAQALTTGLPNTWWAVCAPATGATTPNTWSASCDPSAPTTTAATPAPRKSRAPPAV